MSQFSIKFRFAVQWHFRHLVQARKNSNNDVLVDQQLNGGTNVVEIRDAFQNHSIPLGNSVMLSPQASLPGDAGDEGKIAAAVKKDLLG